MIRLLSQVQTNGTGSFVEYANLTAVGALILILVSLALYLPRYIREMRELDAAKDDRFLQALEKSETEFKATLDKLATNFREDLREQRELTQSLLRGNWRDAV